MKIQPIGKWIALEVIVEEIMSESGLLLTGNDKKNLSYKKGKIIKPGTEVNVIKEGDSIYYSPHNSFSMFIESKEVTFIQERDVLVVV